jgi:hypothetical protein
MSPPNIPLLVQIYESISANYNYDFEHCHGHKQKAMMRIEGKFQCGSGQILLRHIAL